MRSSKKSHCITVRNVPYRWRATGNDDYISIAIWPLNNLGPSIHGSLRYHDTYIDNADGSSSSLGDQIVITSRLIRRIIEHAIAQHRYNSNETGNQLQLGALEGVIEWQDAVRRQIVSRQGD